jgi:hypothetical protein
MRTNKINPSIIALAAARLSATQVWANPTPSMGIWTKITSVLGNFTKNQICEGYQDQDGFHFGVKQTQKSHLGPAFIDNDYEVFSASLK